ncbi:hypothetical protein [Nocardioides sambongensis]|uniref:hypothetical protein n=1 Tax=Nocardioides sambongensis TaxID=2589074 RepID=UPI001125DC20|nr:hypothetical protein [Nocardioides sambongensis]
MAVPEVAVGHLGALHPVEQAVTAALAFGPFLLLGAVILVRRRAESRATPAAPRPGERRSGADPRGGADQRAR